MASKARDLSNFISTAAIDASEIATGAITTDKIADTTITHAKLHTTMDLSGKTVTLPTINALDVTNNINVGGTVDGVDIQTLNTTAGAALPKAGGTMTGTLNINNTLPIIKLTDTNSSGYYSSITQEGSSFKILADEGNVGSGLIRLYVSGAERMRINSSGNVGIGVVPEAWNSSYSAIQFGQQGSLSCQDSLDYTVLAGNAYHATDGDWKYIVTDEAAAHVLNNGTHAFNVAASGSADAAISWTTAMTIDNSGKVGIGTASPLAPLDVSSSYYPILQATATTTNSAALRLRGSLSSGHYWDIQHVHGDNDLAFSWSGGEKMRLDNSAGLILGGTSPGSLSGVDAGLTIRTTNTNSGISYQSGGANTDHWETYASQSARFYIENTNTSNGAYLQYNSGSGWTNISDQRWKTDWTLLEDSSSKITALNIGKYHMLDGSKETIDGAKWDYGVKAQELFEVIPDAVDVPLDPEDKYGVVPNIVFWHTVKALQEALAKIDAMETRLSALEA